MAGALIRFVCRENEHQRARASVNSPVTLHEQEWAFCPAGVAEGHTWERIAGAPLDELRHRTSEVRVKV
ncbi:MAG TPA: hypothetical protein VJZ25_00765 [Gemmatimonadaceae bacterium]|nr:hypothetical protein [Gemmatimonadaceae bacterium]